MDMSDVRNIEFLDLSEVDENEKNRVRASLEHNDPSVQLPWIKTDKKGYFPGTKQAKKNKDVKQTNASHNDAASYKYVQPSAPPTALVNNIFLNQEQQFQPVVMQPLVTNYGGPSHPPPNTVYYSNTLSPVPPAYPQQVFVIPQNNIYPNNIYPYAVASPPLNMPDVSKTHGDMLESDTHRMVPSSNNYTPHDTQNFAGASIAQTSADNTILPVANMTQTISQDTTMPQPILSSPVFENGVGSKPVKESATPSAANKSWASLFNSGSSQNDSVKTDEIPDKTTFDMDGKMESNNNIPLCPIKHPRRAQFVDPDCYRMGEYLTCYAVDGRTISLQPRGLINQSNYCYINSILQALVACPPLYNLLSGLSQNISSNEKRKPTPVIDGMCRFVKEFKQLPANMRVSNRRSEGKSQKKDQGLINTDIPFEPSWIYRMLTGIRTDLIEGRQEDAEEFLGCLLNGINDEMLELMKLVKNDCDESQPTRNKLSESETDKEWQVMGPKNKGSVTRRTDFGRTPISDIFGGFLKSRIHRAGDHITENIQPFFTLQLNIEKVKTVREALEALVAKYQLEGVTSSKTNEEVEAWQQVMLDELPVIMVLHLKCFDFKLDGCTKIVKALEFPIDLKIDTKLLSSKTQSSKEKQYKLFAVVYHDGKEASKGHYVTDAFHVGYSSWLRYDDASVKPVQEEQVLKPQGTRVPYLLFYRRSDTIRSK